MPSLEEAFDLAQHLVESSQVEQDMLGDYDLSEVVTAISGVITGELESITMSDDPELADRIMRQVLQTVGFKSFLAGFLASRVNSGDTVEVQVPAEAIEAIALAAIKSGTLSFSLVTE